MAKKNKKTIDILSSEFKDSFEFTVSDNFAHDVNYQIKYKLLRKSQKRQAILIICVLILFLLSIMFMFLNQTAEVIDETDAILNSLILRYKYIPIIVLSLCLIVVINYTVRLKRWLMR